MILDQTFTYLSIFPSCSLQAVLTLHTVMKWRRMNLRGEIDKITRCMRQMSIHADIEMKDANVGLKETVGKKRKRSWSAFTEVLSRKQKRRNAYTTKTNLKSLSGTATKYFSSQEPSCTEATLQVLEKRIEVHLEIVLGLIETWKEVRKRMD